MPIKKKQKKETTCLICGHTAPQSICTACQAKVQGEAIEKKKVLEKKGKTDKGRT